MADEITKADSLLDAVKEQCRKAKARASGGDKTANALLDSARGNIDAIRFMVKGYESAGNKDSIEYRTLKAYLAQGEDHYNFAAIHAAKRFGFLQEQQQHGSR